MSSCKHDHTLEAKVAPCAKRERALSWQRQRQRLAASPLSHSHSHTPPPGGQSAFVSIIDAPCPGALFRSAEVPRPSLLRGCPLRQPGRLCRVSGSKRTSQTSRCWTRRGMCFLSLFLSLSLSLSLIFSLSFSLSLAQTLLQVCANDGALARRQVRRYRIPVAPCTVAQCVREKSLPKCAVCPFVSVWALLTRAVGCVDSGRRVREAAHSGVWFF